MSDTIQSLKRKIGKARTLDSVVRTMKTLAALNIRQYEEAIRSLDEYYRNVEFGLAASLHEERQPFRFRAVSGKQTIPAIAVVFGSDQGLVGQFNDLLAEIALATLKRLQGRFYVLSIGERMQQRLSDHGIRSELLFDVPNAVSAITPLTGDLLSAIERIREREALFELYLFYHMPVSGELYQPVSKRVLPLDENWAHEIMTNAAPKGKPFPEMPNGVETTRWALLREYLFVSLFRACAESLAAENASRLSAMQRAEKNIDELLDEFTRSYNERRQADIDEELFDVISGFQALDDTTKHRNL